jgi:ABC-type bacteriocin/lantibiotic exporter with double-glycine peptidase domain
LTAIIGTTAGFLCVLIVQLGAGNVISVYWPKKVEPSQMRSRMTSQAAGFASMAVNLPLMAIIGLVVMATWLWHLTWLPLVAGLAGFAASLKLFSSLLDWAERYAHEHLEEIAGKLTA